MNSGGASLTINGDVYQSYVGNTTTELYNGALNLTSGTFTLNGLPLATVDMNGVWVNNSATMIWTGARTIPAGTFLQHQPVRDVDHAEPVRLVREQLGIVAHPIERHADHGRHDLRSQSGRAIHTQHGRRGDSDDRRPRERGVPGLTRPFSF